MKLNPDKGKSPETLAWERGYAQGIANARAALAATPAPAPLTDEQIDKTAKRVIPVAAYMGMFEYAAFSKEDADRTVRHFARAIERAHRLGASTKESNQ